jgi:hypothetical protein
MTNKKSKLAANTDLLHPEKFFNDFNAQEAKSLEIALFRDFSWITPLRCG